MAAARSVGSCPDWLFTFAAHALINPSARMNARGKRRPLMGKFSTARCVWAPYSASPGTRTSPMVSCSMRYMAWLSRTLHFIVFSSTLPDHAQRDETGTGVVADLEDYTNILGGSVVV